MADHQVVSLFSGAGGLDIGFQQAGYRTIWAMIVYIFNLRFGGAA